MAYTQTEYTMLRADLGFDGEPPAAVAAYMQQLLEAARKALEADGIHIDEADMLDEELVAMYAAWLYRKRDTGGGKPRMLREALNDRAVHGKVGSS